jgi:hypothetical protein
MKANYQNAATTDTILYGCNIGEPNYMEEILYQCKGYTNQQELLSKGQQWADKNGYDRLRISVIDLNIAPNFIKAIN